MNALGKTTWLIPDTFLRSKSASSDPRDKSHESVCILNTSKDDAHISFTLYFEDRAPNTAFSAVCPAERTHHVRFDRLCDMDGNKIPTDVPYALLIESDVPVTVQYTRVDTSSPDLALMTTMAYPV